MKNEYDLLKVFAILLVVLGHITILYSGDGSLGYLPQNKITNFITSAIYIFHMPLFVSLSGAIYSIGYENGKYLHFIPFINNKIKRLIVPFIFVGVFFLAPTLVIFKMTNMSFTECVGNILFCCGSERHLWYLPALFWIFIIVWVFTKSKIKVEIMFILSVLIAVICSLFLKFDFFALWNAIQYLPYFILGMLINNYKTIRNSLMLFVGVFIFFTTAIILWFSDISLLDNICRILLPCSIVVMLVSVFRWLSRMINIRSVIWISILKYSFAIYLFHVMIIYVMYNCICMYLPVYVMIPVTFISAMIISSCLAYIIRKLNLQFIIGEN